MPETTSENQVPQDPQEVTHLAPPIGSHVLPCCNLPVGAVPRWHRLTLKPETVTCRGEDGGDE